MADSSEIGACTGLETATLTERLTEDATSSPRVSGGGDPSSLSSPDFVEQLLADAREKTAPVAQSGVTTVPKNEQNATPGRAIPQTTDGHRCCEKVRSC